MRSEDIKKTFRNIRGVLFLGFLMGMGRIRGEGDCHVQVRLFREEKGVGEWRGGLNELSGRDSDEALRFADEVLAENPKRRVDLMVLGSKGSLVGTVTFKGWDVWIRRSS